MLSPAIIFCGDWSLFFCGDWDTLLTCSPELPQYNKRLCTSVCKKKYFCVTPICHENQTSWSTCSQTQHGPCGVLHLFIVLGFALTIQQTNSACRGVGKTWEAFTGSFTRMSRLFAMKDEIRAVDKIVRKMEQDTISSDLFDQVCHIK